MIVNGFEIRKLPNGYVDCVSWCGTVMNTLDTIGAAIEWAKENEAPKLTADAKAELAAMTAIPEPA